MNEIYLGKKLIGLHHKPYFIADIAANKVSLNDFARSGAAMLELVGSRYPLVMAPRPRYNVKT